MPEQRGLSEEFVELVAAACNGTLASDELEKLERFLSDDESRQQFYIDYLRLDAELAAHGQHQRAEAIIDEIEQTKLATPAKRVSPCDSPNPSVATRVYCFFAKPTPLSMSVATLVIGILLTAMAFMAPPFFRHLAGGNAEPTPTATPFVGRITDMHEAQWESPGWGQDRGVYLQQGHIVALQSGLVEVTLKSGVRMTIEGPAEVELTSRNTTVLNYGNVVAYVPPPAVGFELSTPMARIVDLGTSFGASQDAGHGNLALEVFSGLIEISPTRPGAASFRMSKGERLAVTTHVIDQPEKAVQFVRHIPGGRHAPAQLLGLYTFDGNARDSSGQGRHAQVSNVDFLSGVQGSAASFAGDVDSFIDLPINVNPSHLPELTWGAWVRPSKFVRRGAILSTDDGGFDRMLTIDDRSGVTSGASNFASHAGSGVLRSSSPMLPIPGRWSFVACVYDNRAGTVTLYSEAANGELQSDVVRNARPAEGKNFVRVGMHAGGLPEAFPGEIDNVFVFRGKLNTQQLAQIRAGGPGAVLELNQLFANEEMEEDE